MSENTSSRNLQVLTESEMKVKKTAIILALIFAISPFIGSVSAAENPRKWGAIAVFAYVNGPTTYIGARGGDGSTKEEAANNALKECHTFEISSDLPGKLSNNRDHCEIAFASDHGCSCLALGHANGREGTGEAGRVGWFVRDTSEGALNACTSEGLDCGKAYCACVK